MKENTIERLVKLERERDLMINHLDSHCGYTREIILSWWWDIYRKYEPRENELDNLYAWNMSNFEFKRSYIK